MDFDTMVHITVLMKTIGLRGTQNGPPKMSKNDFLTKTTKKIEIYFGLISQPNNGFWHYGSYYSTLENYRETQTGPPKISENDFHKNDYKIENYWYLQYDFSQLTRKMRALLKKYNR